VWQVTPRIVRSQCLAGKVRGAAKIGRDWRIPPSAVADPHPELRGRVEAAHEVEGGSADEGRAAVDGGRAAVDRHEQRRWLSRASRDRHEQSNWLSRASRAELLKLLR
jgi:hypothetical protein